MSLDSRPGTTGDQTVEDQSMRTILKELIGRTRDFESLDNAFCLFVLQNNTYDVEKATMLIKQGMYLAPILVMRGYCP